MKIKRDKLFTVILIVIFLAGFSVMMYPTFSDWWNKNRASRVISSYIETVAEIDTTEQDKMFADAEAYNKALRGVTAPFSNPEEAEGYEDTLNISGTGIMGYITIPTINVQLPIYHGTSPEVLNIAVGHLEGSTLPIGGASTHAVISAHRGLPSAKLFTDLDRLVEGDTFTITVLDEVLTYEVDQIRIVLPDQFEDLAVIPGGDYVTLMTCTPYGINTHRLLVRAHRIDNAEEPVTIRVPADAAQIDEMTVIPMVFVPLLLLLILFWILTGKKRRNWRIDKYITEKLPREKEDD